MLSEAESSSTAVVIVIDTVDRILVPGAILVVLEPTPAFVDTAVAIIIDQHDAGEKIVVDVVGQVLIKQTVAIIIGIGYAIMLSRSK